jgi:hypothetical protein
VFQLSVPSYSNSARSGRRTRGPVALSHPAAGACLNSEIRARENGVIRRNVYKMLPLKGVEVILEEKYVDLLATELIFCRKRKDRPDPGIP